MHDRREFTKDPIQLQQKVIHLNSELIKYKAKVKQYQENYHYSMIDSLQNKNNELSKEFEEVSKRFTQTNELLNKRSRDTKKQVQFLKEQLEELKEETSTYQKEKEDLVSEQTSYIARLDVQKNEIRVLMNRLNQKQQECESQQAAYDMLAKESNEYKNDMERVEVELKHQIDFSEKEKEILQEKLETTIQTSHTEQENQRRNQKALHGQINELKSNLALAEEQQNMSEEKNKRIQAENENLLKERSTYQKEKVDLANKQTSYIERLDVQKREIRVLMNRLNHKQQECESQQAAYDMLEKETNEHKNDMERVQVELKRQIAFSEKEKEVLQKKLKSTIQTSHTEQEGQRRNQKVLQEQIDELKSSLAIAEEQRRLSEEKNKRIQVENETFLQKLDELTEKNDVHLEKERGLELQPDSQEPLIKMEEDVQNGNHLDSFEHLEQQMKELLTESFTCEKHRTLTPIQKVEKNING
ncbi:hypothetical protein [Jeotgalibacillus marinus]|uniref:Uncharacterized protein n=1 Tax=Jeotgalibacillus marinus TaxID=86667 RepID=A0ABV3Q1M2_9BACL